MRRNKIIIGNIFFAILLIGLLFLVVEILFQYHDKSICPTEGCKIVNQQTRFGEVSIILIGIASLTALLALSFFTLYRNKTGLEKYINLVLIVSLASEGFFAGYQAFWIQTACIMCLSILGIFLILGALRLLYGEYDVIAGFLSFAGVFALLYLILPTGETVSIPNDDLILFYSNNCPFCEEVKKEIEASKLKVTPLLAKDYTVFLKNLGIEHVPALYVNKKNQKIILIGKDEINRFLFSNQETEVKKQTKILQKEHQAKIKIDSHKDTNGNKINKLLLPQDTSILPYSQPAEEGACKIVEASCE